MGGTLTIYSGTQDFGLAGLMAFYSGFSRKLDEAGTALDVSPRLSYPFLGSYGGADPAVSVDLVEQLDKNLNQAKIEHDIKIYPGAGHSFFDKRQVEFAKASADAWQRMLSFIQAHSPS